MTDHFSDFDQIEPHGFSEVTVAPPRHPVCHWGVLSKNAGSDAYSLAQKAVEESGFKVVHAPLEGTPVVIGEKSQATVIVVATPLGGDDVGYLVLGASSDSTWAEQSRNAVREKISKAIYFGDDNVLTPVDE
jgi:hypothetical protein